MPEEGLRRVAGSAVVQEKSVIVHAAHETDAPERRRSPFAAFGFERGAIVGKPLAHVVQQQIRIRMDFERAELR